MRVGLDVGGTKIGALALGDDGAVRSQVRRPSGHGRDALVASVVDALRLLADAEGVALSSFSSIGIGIPGMVHPGTAVVRHAVNLGVTDLDVGAALAGAVDAPVRVENDVKAAALGAAALRDGRRGTTLGYLNLGTGVAAGIIVDGELWRGPRGAAGEIGHLVVDPSGPRCRCGQHGCVEAFAGGGALAARWGRDVEHPVLDLFDAADRGDATACGLRADMVRAVAAAVRVLVLTVDVDSVVIGGGLASLGARIAGPVQAELRAAAASPLLASLGVADRMELLPAGAPAGALGAALVGAAASGRGRGSDG